MADSFPSSNLDGKNQNDKKAVTRLKPGNTYLWQEDPRTETERRMSLSDESELHLERERVVHVGAIM